MDPMTLIPYVIGAAAYWAIQRWGGGKIPLPPAPVPPIPVPVPVPSPAPVPDKEATDFLAWLLKVKSGFVRLDDHDRATLALIKPALADVLPDEVKK